VEKKKLGLDEEKKPKKVRGGRKRDKNPGLEITVRGKWGGGQRFRCPKERKRRLYDFESKEESQW